MSTFLRVGRSDERADPADPESAAEVRFHHSSCHLDIGTFPAVPETLGLSRGRGFADGI
jgi:hypothetical protein